MNKFSLTVAALAASSTLLVGFAIPRDTVAPSDTVTPIEHSIEGVDDVSPPADLPVYEGFEADWQQANDEMIVRVVGQFNADNGWTVGDPDYLDPALVKAWALQESGGHPEIFTSGDMMQMNNGGDWAPEKVHVGVDKGERLSPEESLVAGLQWAYQKGEETRTGSAGGEWAPAVRGGQAVSGYVTRFTDWERAITRYNGGGVPDYFGDITRRMSATA